ncbi:NAD(P)-binding domain-containing protein [Streptomyces sp. NBC_00287]|uniref:NADPH-dependent F420 reductase n=1 Tax=Streptomyces sp. NBC_00287 TaxID=2975702 RepID=UPI002E2A432B|nr:NAD(P)-binding domain-containing protein [Streptomyces sp. NBC_00287]
MTTATPQRLTLVGAGNMARGIATRALAGRHTVRILGRDTAKAEKLVADLAGTAPDADVRVGGEQDVAAADIVVLALPFEAAKAVAASHAAVLDGKTVVDITNPVDYAGWTGLTVPAGTSAAEEIAASAPGAHVVKAFNTTFAGTLAAGSLPDGVPLDLFLAGDDEEAKGQVARIGRDGGMHVIDAGPLARARELEGFQFLHMALQGSLGSNWMSGIKIVLP